MDSQFRATGAPRGPRVVAIAAAVLFAGLGSMLWGASAHAAFIEMRAPSSVEVGNQASIEVWADGLDDEFIGTYDLTVDFDPLLVSFVGVDFGIGLDGPGDSVTGVLPGDGFVELFEVSFGFLDNQTGTDAFRLFTLTFATLAVGVADFSFGFALVSDELGVELSLSGLFGASLNIASREPPIAVPEPGSAGLLLGLFGAGLLARRCRNRLETGQRGG